MAINRRTAGGVARGLVTLVAALAVAFPTATRGSLGKEPPYFPPGGWKGPDGQPLPFATDEAVVSFLRTANVVSMTEISDGRTRPQKALLERGGVKAHAIFRSLNLRQEPEIDPDTGRTWIQEFRDSAIFEAAAYELALLLDLPFVPPTVRRVVDNRDGTLQLWIENAMSEQDRIDDSIAPPHNVWWRGVFGALLVFDNLLFNADRNTSNLLIDPDWNVWFIDHTRGFQVERKLRNPEHVVFCERRLWERLRALSDDDIKDAVGEYLDARELMALLARRERLVKHIERLIEENGEQAVIYDYSYYLADWSEQRDKG